MTAVVLPRPAGRVRRPGRRAVRVLWLGLPALWLFGRSNGLGTLAALAATLGIALSLVLLAICVRRPERHLFLVTILLTGTMLVPLRGLLGRLDLGNTPQAYVLSFRSYNRTVYGASLAFCAMAVAYLAVRFISTRRTRPERRTFPFASLEYLVVGAAAIGGRLFLLVSFGLGGKGTKSPFPGSGLILLGLISLSQLVIAALLLDAMQRRSRARLRLGLLLLAADAAVGTLGGSRGALFRDAVMLVACWLVTSRVRVAWRTALTATAVLLVVLLGTTFAVEQRQRVAGGRSFAVGEFLTLRASGVNRIAPVVDSGVRVGWKEALQRPETHIKRRVYGIPGSRSIGVSTHALGVGYLASGLSGALLVGAVLGGLARVIDALMQSSRRPEGLAVYVVGALLFAELMQGVSTRRQVNELIAFAAVAVGMLALRGSARAVVAVTR